MDADTAARNLKNDATWRRLVYMIVFVIAFQVSEAVLWAVVVVQFLSKVFSGKPIERASAFGQNLASYVYQIIVFLTFRSDETPWPFGPWPDGPPPAEPAANAGSAETQGSAEPGKRRRRRSPRKKGEAGS